MMKKLVRDFDELVERLDGFEPKTDATAWLRRELFETLARARGMLEAIANSEED